VNDERDIEKQLRGYAGQRRKDAGEPRPLHPATRNLLQGEVGRLRAEHRSRHSRFSWSEFLFGSWQRVTASLSTAAAVVLVGIALLHNPAADESRLAKNDATPQEKEKSAFTELAKKQELGPGAERLAMSPAGNRTNAAAATALSTAPTLALDQSTAARSLATPPAIQTAAPQPAQPLLASADLAGQKRFADQADVVTRSREVFAGVTQEFTRITSPALPARRADGGPAGVLDSFRVEQNGDQIRVVDRDGSVYTGSVALAGTPAAASLLAGDKPAAVDALAKDAETGALREKAATGEIAVNQPAARKEVPAEALPQPTGVAAVSGAAPAAGYLFRVSGTNLSLNQPVEFTGNFVADAEPAVVGQYRQIGGGGGGGAGASGSGGVAARGGRRGGGGGGARGGAFTPITNAVAANATATDAISNVARSSAVGAEPAADGAAAKYFRIQGQATVGGSKMEINAQTAPNGPN
jgi:hypothetical protein